MKILIFRGIYFNQPVKTEAIFRKKSNTNHTIKCLFRTSEQLHEHDSDDGQSFIRSEKNETLPLNYFLFVSSA